jgi:hypothetical protein
MDTRDAPDRRNSQPNFDTLLQQRITRRTLLEGGAGLLGLGALGTAAPAAFAAGTSKVSDSNTGFSEIESSRVDAVRLPPGYTFDLVVRWGDALWSDTASLDTATMRSGALFAPAAAAAQARQFGSHCDAIQYYRLDTGNAQQRSRSGVLCVNHEYTGDDLLFPGRRSVWGTDPTHIRELVTAHPGLVHYTKAAHGLSVIEIARPESAWQLRRDSRYNRRVTADTPIDLRGPARGAAWLRTSADPGGTTVLGTLANCAGGRTPWGSYLSGEENLQDYFGNFAALRAARGSDPAMLRAHRRVRHWASVSPHGWELVDARFDALAEPHEAFRFGWIVEIDPLDPSRRAVKRTALGRMAHEAATPVVATNGRLAVYMGDDDVFEYIYKFVSNGRVATGVDAKRANDQLLDEGVLYVARFDADGSGTWLPLQYDPAGPLHAAAGFRDQAEVLIQTRAAADAVGATPMDRPEDIEVHPTNGRIYVACTRNEVRQPAPLQRDYAGRSVNWGVNAANPRAANLYGHIIEITEERGDHTGLRFRWDALLMGPAAGAAASGVTTLGSPDNLGFDSAGRLWVVTDGPQPDGGHDGCYVCETSGPRRGSVKRFMTAPRGAEVAGCVFAPGDDTLFISIQHPGEGGTLDRPSSDWPDGGGSQPRSSVIAIRRADGGIVGT